MNCQFEYVRDGLVRCANCGEERRSIRKRMCGSSLPAAGPGTCLLQIFREISITPKKGCDCEKLRKEMDAAGVDGCRERKAEFIERLQSNAAKFGLSEWAAAGWQAVRQGKPLTLAGLYDLAIERAASRANQ